MKKTLLVLLLFSSVSLLATAQLVEKVIARETFGNKSWDTDGPSQPVGFATHWDWDDINTWTSWNGHIEGGSDSSYRINNYDPVLEKPAYWREPEGQHHAHMAIRTGDSYVGSWDTTYYMAIDISNADPVTAIEFGYVRARTVAANDTFHRSLNVEYRIDGGSWEQADTTLIIPQNVYLKWDYIVMPVELRGTTLDLRFSCIQENEQIYLDDITVVAMVPAVEYAEGMVTRETFGNKSWDTDGPSQPVGFPTHWDWDDINTWTSWNGHIEGGSDSSYRINNYDPTLEKPAYWREPEGQHHAHMAIRTGDSYVGSWDTTYFMGIDISQANPVTAIEFGYVRARTVAADDTFHRSLNVEYRVNGGAWLQADTTLIIPQNVYLKWDYIVMPVNLMGDVLDLRFSCLQENEQIYLDDITVIGMLPVPEGTQDFSIANVIVGTVDDAADFTGKLHLSWDADSVYMFFAIADDSIVNTGASYQCDNLEIYWDLDNSKTVHYPRNQGWQQTVDYTYDDNDFQLRLVPDVDFSVNNGTRPSMVNLGGVKQAYEVTDTGYNFTLNIAWDSLWVGFVPVEDSLIGFDVLVSDNDDAAHINDANRNQITFNSPTDKPFNDPSLFATLMIKPDGYWELIPDEDAPAAPGNFTGVNDSATVTLSWDLAVDNIATLLYRVYQGGVIIDSVYARENGNQYVINDLAEGSYSFGVDASDNYGNISTKSLIYVTVDYPSSVELTNGEQFRIYPNPVANELNIVCPETVERIQIISITGTMMLNTSNVGIVNVADLKPGLYMVKVQTRSDVYTDTFVKE
jgi:hypothetical protein